MATETFTLGGRTFALADETTSRQDGWLMVQLEDSGILDLLFKRSAAGASAEPSDEIAFARKLITQARRSGKFELIAACVLVEPGVKWSIDEAKKNAEAFGDLTDPAEKVNLALAFANGLSRFFLSASGFSISSPTASAAESTGADLAPRDAPTPSTNGLDSIDASAAPGPIPSDGSPMATAIG